MGEANYRAAHGDVDSVIRYLNMAIELLGKVDQKQEQIQDICKANGDT